MNIELREVKKEDKEQIYMMYKEYIEADPIDGIDTFEGIRDFEKLKDMAYEDWLEYLEINKDKNKLPSNYSSHTLYLVLNEDKWIGYNKLDKKDKDMLK